jgi:hypothetical protein
MLNIISAYAPQVGCAEEEKKDFWQKLEETLEKIPREERVVLGADPNGHVGEGNNGDEGVMGRHGMGGRNEEGQTVVEFAKQMELAICNTYFMKKPAQRITYNSGGRNSQIDYLLVRRNRIKDCLVVCKLEIWTKWQKKAKHVRRIKWWKLKDPEMNNKFRDAVEGSGVFNNRGDWQSVAEAMRGAAKAELGETSGKQIKEDKETWWWNMEGQEAVKMSNK